MNRQYLKEYHRPYMFVESFVPNEFVAGCLTGSVKEAVGQMCFDLDHDGFFDWEPDERGYLSYPLGTYEDNFLAGKFKVTKKGRYIYEEGGETYLYVGPGTIDDPGLSGISYDLNSNIFLPIYYANVEIEENYSPIPHKTVYYFTSPDGLAAVSNAS